MVATQKKIVTKLISKNSQTHQKITKLLEMVASLRKKYFFHSKSVVYSSFIFRLVFYQKAYWFSTFSKHC